MRSIIGSLECSFPVLHFLQIQSMSDVKEVISNSDAIVQ